MTLYFADTTIWEVREVEGEPWPGKDQFGNICYENTHFKTRGEAIAKLRSEARAWVIMAGRDIPRKEQALDEARKDAAEAAKVFARMNDTYPKD